MTPAPTRITENMVALCGLEDVWYIAGASLRSRTAMNQRVGRMSDGFLRVNYFVSSFGMICFCLKPHIVVLQETIFVRRYVLVQEDGWDAPASPPCFF